MGRRTTKPKPKRKTRSANKKIPIRKASIRPPVRGTPASPLPTVASSHPSTPFSSAPLDCVGVESYRPPASALKLASSSKSSDTCIEEGWPLWQKALAVDLDVEEEVEDLNALFSHATSKELADKQEQERQEMEVARQYLERDYGDLFEEREIDTWRPNELPVGVRLGDPCFIRSNNNLYVNAILKGFHPAARGKTKDMYEVETQFDNNRKGKDRKIPRTQVLFKMDQAFATCNRMEVIVEVMKGSTQGLPDRAPSPPPEAGPSTYTSTQLSALSTPMQLRHIRPHLHKIINEDYAPAQARIDTFMRGRRGEVSTSARFGDLHEEEVSSVIVPEIMRWALRADRWSDHDSKPLGWESEPPRPTGSLDYEALSPQRRFRFILDVLVFEAIICMCRLEFDLDTGREEQEAYESALSKLEELAANSPAKRWGIVAAQLNAERRGARERAGLPSETPSNYSKDVERQKQFDDQLEKNEIGISRGGRVRKTHNYKV